jgi:hypothetical protein
MSFANNYCQFKAACCQIFRFFRVFRVQNNLCDSASLRSKNKFSGTNFLAIVANFLESSQAPQGAF